MSARRDFLIEMEHPEPLEGGSTLVKEIRRDFELESISFRSDSEIYNEILEAGLLARSLERKEEPGTIWDPGLYGTLLPNICSGGAGPNPRKGTFGPKFQLRRKN